MKVLFGVFLLLIFLAINIAIIISDYKHEKIPNKYLLLLIILLPFWYIYALYYGYFLDISLLIFSMQIFFCIIIGYCIYEFNIWGAGDAKYLCLLGLYIPHIGILDFIGNIGLITLVYLILYLIWFWLRAHIGKGKKIRDFYTNIWIIKKQQFLDKKKNMTLREFSFASLNGLNLFLLIFLSLRFSRIYILGYISQKYDILFLLQNYGIYILIGIVSLLLGVSLLLKYIFSLFKKYIFTTANHQTLFICFLSMLGIGCLIYGYLNSPIDFSEKILLIFTFYLAIFILIKILWEICKTTFKMQEQPLIHVDNLQAGMMIDKAWFDLILARDRDIFGDIALSGKILSQDDVELVQKVIGRIQDSHTTPYIPTHKTFGFGLYIFGGFVITFLYGSLFISLLITTYKIFILG